MKTIFIVASVWIISLLGLQAQSYVMLETDAKGKMTVSGDKTLLSKYYPPASTFKELIAWEAFKQGVARPGTMHLCPDMGEIQVNMCQAMFASSNDYFNWVASQLDAEKFDAFIKKSGLGGTNFHPGIWKEAGADGMARGGNLTVTVEQLHAFSNKILNASQSRESDYLRKVLRRPWWDDNIMIFGKTGAWGGAVWMTGFYDPVNEKDKRKTVTVFVPYTVPKWKPAKTMALAKFYGSLGMSVPADYP